MEENSRHCVKTSILYNLNMRSPRACAFILLALLCPLRAAAQSALTFDEASRLTLSANPQAVAAARALDAAASRITVSKAGLFPQIAANAAYSRLGTEPLPYSNSYSYGLSATQPLFSPALPATVRSAKASYHRTEADYDRIKSNLLFKLRTTFSDLWKARETIKLSEGTLKRRADNVEIIRIKYEAGRESKAALLEIKAAYTTAKWQHEGYKKDLRLLERKFNRLTGRSPIEAAATDALPEPPPPPENLEAVNSALERHPSLRSARASLETAQASVDRSVSGFLPDANANGRYSWSGSHWPDKTKDWSAGVSLSLPIFAGGKHISELAASRADRSGADASLKNARDEVFLNAEDALRSWRQAWLYMDVAGSSLEAANARAWLLRKQYLAGQASYFEWRIVEDQFIGAENQILAAKRDLQAAHAAFINSIGE